MKRLLIYIVLPVAVVLITWKFPGNRLPASEQVGLGLEVYLGEGCIHCHSQYRRPVGPDSALWGASTDTNAELDSQQPVVFGNRRQGPDLSNIGIRRSRDWNRIHLIDPQGIRSSSRMPAYPHLFTEDNVKGEALLDYLESLGSNENEEHQEWTTNWLPSEPLMGGNSTSGYKLFTTYCVSCHGSDGSGNGPLASNFNPAPRNLQLSSAWLWVDPSKDQETQRVELARLIRFGHPGSSMAGTEWLSESELSDLIRFLKTLQQTQG
jgi:mono/diheme cytochrome c family protein